MNTTTRTLQLPGSVRLAAPMREIGASGIDQRAAAWPAPDPAMMIVDIWAPPTATPLLALDVLSPWAAPAASGRVAMASPATRLLAPPHPNAVPISTVEPMHAVRLPDLVALARVSAGAPPARRRRRSSVPSKPRRGTPSAMAPIDATPVRLPRPSITDLVRSDEQAAGVAIAEAAAVDRSGVSRRLVAAVAVGAGVCVAAAAALSALL